MYGITDLKKGTLIELDDKPYLVVEYAQKQLGRGGSIVNTKLKNLIDGGIMAKTFKGAEKIKPAEVSKQSVQYLYCDDDFLYFMDPKTFEQYQVALDDREDQRRLLVEGSQAILQFFDGQPINVELPVKVPIKVTEAPQVVKGDTQSTVLKEVKLETGLAVQAPMFIKPGDVIIVDTRDSSYVERQK